MEMDVSALLWNGIAAIPHPRRSLEIGVGDGSTRCAMAMGNGKWSLLGIMSLNTLMK